MAVKQYLYQTLLEAKIAVRALGISSQSEYHILYKSDSRLPSNPQQTYKNEWIDWYDYLQNPRPAFYVNFSDASTSAQKLGINNAISYEKNYIRDVKLPSRPRDEYHNEWRSWPHFLGKHYQTIEEVRNSLSILCITSYTEYGERRNQDPKLPQSRQLAHYYGQDALVELFGSKTYRTLQEAATAAKALGINSYDSYRQLRHQDARLPASPSQVYEEFIDWHAFFSNFYPNPEIARQAIDHYKVVSLKQYDEIRITNPALPPHPHRYYGLKNFHEFLNFKFLTVEEVKTYCQINKISNLAEYTRHCKKNPKLRRSHALPGYVSKDSILYKKDYFDDCPKEYIQWIEFARKFTNGGKNITRRREVLRSFINEYLYRFKHPTTPGHFFHFKHDQGDLDLFFESLSNSKRGTSTLNLLNNFLDFVLKACCGEADEDTGEVYIVPGYRNRFLNAEVNNLDETGVPSESVKPVLPFNYVAKAREWVVPSDARSFCDLLQIRECLEADWIDVDPKQIDHNDPDCVWRIIERKVTSKRKAQFHQVWSPVRAIALYTLLQVPLRGQQILWLDSGEADEWTPSIDDGSDKILWSKNTGILSHYRKKEGFVKRFTDPVSETTGMYVTTNKTGFVEGGYSISWIPPQLTPWIIRLRNWQAKFNPLSAPTKWTDIKIGRAVDHKILCARGSQTFLFRDPCGLTDTDRQSPISTGKALSMILPVVLYNIQSNDVALAERNLSVGGLIAYTSDFTPHSLRVSLITAYILDGNIAVPFISKLVGHASIVMTIYYAKISQPDMNREMLLAEQRMLINSTDRIHSMVLAGEIENASNELFSVRGNFLSTLTSKWPRASFVYFDWGVCPMAGAGCKTGGQPKESGKGFEPVPIGYLGPQNCPHCRFLISGPAFLGGITALANEISLNCSAHAQKLVELERTIRELDEEEFDLAALNIEFTKNSERYKSKEAYARESTKLDVLTTDLIMCHRIAKRSIELLNNNEADSGRVQLIASDAAAFSIGLDERTEFHQLNNICLNADLYAFSNPSRAISRRSQIFDHMLQRNNFDPIFFKLSPSQQLKAGNQLSEILVSKLGDYRKLDQLTSGESKLRELLDVENLDSCESQLVNLFKGRTQNNLQLANGA